MQSSQLSDSGIGVVCCVRVYACVCVGGRCAGVDRLSFERVYGRRLSWWRRRRRFDGRDSVGAELRFEEEQEPRETLWRVLRGVRIVSSQRGGGVDIVIVIIVFTEIDAV